MFKRLTSKFLKKSDGGVTVEFVMWFPSFIAIFALMVDTAMVFHGQATVLKAIQDGNRALATGRITTESATEDWIETALKDINIEAEANARIVAGVVTTTVNVQAGQLQILGYFSAFENLKIGVTSDQMIENWEV